MSAFDRQEGGSHYRDFVIQPTEFIRVNEIRWCEGNAIKYACRHRLKGGAADIRKAIHYLEILLEKEYRQVREPVKANDDEALDLLLEALSWIGQEPNPFDLPAVVDLGRRIREKLRVAGDAPAS